MLKVLFEPIIILAISVVGVTGGVYQWLHAEAIYERTRRSLEGKSVFARRYAQYHFGSPIDDKEAMVKRLRFTAAFVIFIGFLFLAAYVAVVVAIAHNA